MRRYVLIDYENMRDGFMVDLPKLLRNVTVIIFLSEHVKRSHTTDVLTYVHQFKGKLEFVEITGSGKNNMDFHIVAELCLRYKKGHSFYILSGDTGFDNVLQTLRSRGMYCQRITSLLEDGLVRDM